MAVIMPVACGEVNARLDEGCMGVGAGSTCVDPPKCAMCPCMDEGVRCAGGASVAAPNAEVLSWWM